VYGYIINGVILQSSGVNSQFSNGQRKSSCGVYTHETVIHDVNFVNPDNPGIHTQNIENMWIRVKENYVDNLERQGHCLKLL
jgi:hypothetical protein